MFFLRLITIFKLILIFFITITSFSISLANWSKEILISDKNFNSINPSITSDSKGNIYIVWQTKNNNIQDIYFSKFDGRWSPIDKIAETKGTPRTPVIISDILNNLHLVWQDNSLSNYNIYYESYNKKFSAGWLRNIRVSRENSQAASPDIIADKTGNIYIAWQDLENGIYEIFYKKFEIDKGWQPDVKLTKGLVSAANPKLAVDKYNNLHLVWRDNRDGNYEIYYKYFDGKNWSEDFRLTTDPASSESPEIAVDNYQNVHVVWRDNRDKTYAIYYKKWNGKTWEPDQKVSNSNNASASITNPGITIDILGVIHIVWQDNRDGNYEIYYKKFDGKWSEDSRITNDKYNSYNPKIISDSVANLHLVWYNQEKESSYIYYKKFSSPRPLIKAVKDFKVNSDTGASGQAEPSLAINTHGTIFMCWSDVRMGEFNSDIYAQVYNKDFIKERNNFRVNTDKKASIQGHPRVSLFSNDYFGVVWQDERNENMDIYCQIYDVGCDPKGDNFKINDDETLSEQDQPDIAGLKNKPAIIIWRDERNGQLEIYGQILDITIPSAGNFKITQFPKKTYCRWPAVSVSNQGFYIAVWADNRGGKWDIYGQKIQMDGKLTGKNFKINEMSTENCNHPEVACDLNGNFIVTWWSSSKGNTIVIYAQYFDENTKPIGKNFLTGDNNTGDVKQIDPVIDIDSNGNSIIAWLDYRNGDPDIYAQRYDPKGIDINYNFPVNNRNGEDEQTKTGSSSIYEGIVQNEPQVKFQQNGNIIFAWVDHKMGNPDIFACRFEPVNMLPVADPGPDFIWEVNMAAAMDGTASRDPDGDPIVSYSWVQTAGPEVILENPQSSKPGFTPKSIGGPYTFKLVVNDGLINSEPAFINITIIDNTPPMITIENIYPLNKEYVRPRITIRDNSNLPVNTTITLDEGTYVPGAIISEKGDHILDIIAIDRSGNTSYKQVKFRIE
ncbi:MAG: hypothetical protein AB1498_01575 [bacterium]